MWVYVQYLPVSSNMYRFMCGHTDVLCHIYFLPSSIAFCSGGTLIFDETESSQRLYIDIINDDQPELDETFQVELTNATGDSVIDTQGRIDVVIATNDNAHGIIGFAEVSLSVILIEVFLDF